jgi:hypothetical protein
LFPRHFELDLVAFPAPAIVFGDFPAQLLLEPVKAQVHSPYGLALFRIGASQAFRV